ncbi:MAG: c-type cytochrome biogenesis protein CcsB, partial [Actinobacteria bacterium]|nr:c-type cytochrome biogenesis protein CcsB [Actinomycetota bacterium]
MAGINGSMAHLSDGLFTTAIATYAVAMVGFTAEYAFTRVGRKLTVATPARELVGAGGPPTVESPPTSAPPAAPRRPMADRIGRWSVAIAILGALIHTASISVRAIAVDAVPWSNMYEFASVAGLVGIVAFLVLLWRLPALRYLGGFILLPVIL